MRCACKSGRGGVVQASAVSAMCLGVWRVNFVDHYSRLGICYFMRKKSEVLNCFKMYFAELAYYGHRVQHLHSDRGGEYLSQEGELIAGEGRSLGELDKYCVSLSKD